MLNNFSEDNIRIEKKNRKLMNRVLIIGFIFLFSVLSFWAGLEKGKKEKTDLSKEVFSLEQTIISNKESNIKNLDFSLFWKTWDLVKEKFVDSEKLDSQKLFYGAIKGMLGATGDPYTNFFDPEENKKFNEDIAGSFEGIGAEIGVKDGILTIIAPLEGTPAEKAGLRAGDKIIRIEGQSTAEITIDEAVDKLHGPKGTEVKMDIFREGEEDTKNITVIRDVINVKSVKFEDKGNGIAYLKLSRFGENTFQEFGAAAKQIKSYNPKGIILDLRNNPGGYLETAIDIAGKMLVKGSVVVIEENKAKEQRKMFTKGGDEFSQIKTIVLINEGSASASEILAGALKENRENVTLLGMKSFGKGSVQELISLSQGTAIKITVAHWLTPNGNQINEEGINPDVEIEFTEDDYNNDRDPQLDKAIEILKQ